MTNSNVSDFERKFKEQFIAYLSGDPDYGILLSVPTNKRPIIFREYVTEDDFRNVFVNFNNTLCDSLNVSHVSLTMSNNNRNGADFKEVNTDIGIEIKLGSATDVNIGVTAASIILGESLTSLLPQLEERKLWRDLFFRDEVSAIPVIVEAHKNSYMAFADLFNSLSNTAISDDGQNVLNDYFLGNNIIDSESETIKRFSLVNDGSWVENDRGNPVGVWVYDIAKISAQSDVYGTHRLNFWVKNESMNVRLKLVYNYKNTYRSSSPEFRADAKLGLGSPSFNGWWQDTPVEDTVTEVDANSEVLLPSNEPEITVGSESVEFSDLTLRFVGNTTLSDRKKKGQYMTPPSLGDVMCGFFNIPLNSGRLRVLDPAAGTGELLLAMKRRHPSVDVEYHGWDIDDNILETLKLNVPEANVSKRSIFNPLPDDVQNSFDLIIANPPYFEVKKNTPGLTEAGFVTSSEAGRLNIYALFFEYALKLLKPGGQLVFLTPPSFNSGAYFRLTRENILNNSRIDGLKIFRESNLFDSVQQAVQITHLTKTLDGYDINLRNSDRYVFDFNNVTSVEGLTLPTIFTDNKQVLVGSWVDKVSLYGLGFKVKTGSTVWNTHKELFNPHLVDKAPLIYSKDIKHDSNILDFHERLHERRWLPNNLTGIHTGQSIIVNRIIGGVQNPSLKYALVDLPKYYTENHVNVITKHPNSGHPEITLEDIYVRLTNTQPWVTKYLQALTGNTQLSATELQYLIPL